MLKYLLILPLLFAQNPGPALTGATASQAVAAFTVLHTYSCGSTANFVASTTCTITATTANSSLLVAYNIFAGAAATISPACSASLTYVGTSNNDGVSACLISGVAAGTTSVTVTYNSTYTETSIFIAELGGLATSSALDASVGMVQASNSTTQPTGSVTTTNANDVIFGIVGSLSLSANTLGTGYTLLGNSIYNTTSNTQIWIEYQVVSATGTYNPGVTTGDVYSALGTMAVKL